MFKLIAKNLYFILSILATIGGVVSLYQIYTATNEYDISLHMVRSDLVITNNSALDNLKVLYKGKEIASLYATALKIINTGRRALTNKHIYKALQIDFGKGNIILNVSPSGKNVTYSGNLLGIKWDLLNPGEKIDLLVMTTLPPNIEMQYKIQEIEEIKFVNEISDPPLNKRLNSIDVIWLVLIVASILITIDAIMLVKGDIKLSRIFWLTKRLKHIESISAKEYLRELQDLYSEYYSSVPILFVAPKHLIDELSSVIGNNQNITERLLEQVRIETVKWVRYGNLYSIRSSSIFIGPILFGFCFIKISWILMS